MVDNEVNNLKKASHGYALDGRVVYRPVLDSKKLIHIGFAANYRTPNESLNEEDKNIFIYKSPGVSTIDNRNIAMATIDHAAYQIKFGTELLVYYHRFCLQSEYIRTHVERDNAFIRLSKMTTPATMISARDGKRPFIWHLSS